MSSGSSVSCTSGSLAPSPRSEQDGQQLKTVGLVSEQLQTELEEVAARLLGSVPCTQRRSEEGQTAIDGLIFGRLCESRCLQPCSDVLADDRKTIERLAGQDASNSPEPPRQVLDERAVQQLAAMEDTISSMFTATHLGKPSALQLLGASPCSAAAAAAEEAAAAVASATLTTRDSCHVVQLCLRAPHERCGEEDASSPGRALAVRIGDTAVQATDDVAHEGAPSDAHQELCRAEALCESLSANVAEWSSALAEAQAEIGAEIGAVVENRCPNGKENYEANVGEAHGGNAHFSDVRGAFRAITQLVKSLRWERGRLERSLSEAERRAANAERRAEHAEKRLELLESIGGFGFWPPESRRTSSSTCSLSTTPPKRRGVERRSRELTRFAAHGQYLPSSRRRPQSVDECYKTHPAPSHYASH